MRLLTNRSGDRVAISTGLVKNGTTLPVDTEAGDLWIDTDDLILYSYDGVSSTQLGVLQ